MACAFFDKSSESILSLGDRDSSTLSAADALTADAFTDALADAYTTDVLELAATEGQLLTPTLAGRHLKSNSTMPSPSKSSKMKLQ